MYTKWQVIILQKLEENLKSINRKDNQALSQGVKSIVYFHALTLRELLRLCVLCG